jgi:hypothetical protein
MKGKHKNIIVHFLATAQRERLRSKLAKLVEWQPLARPEGGCTAIIGACSKLPDILMANLRCLSSSKWSELKRVIVVMDCVKTSIPPGLESGVKNAFPELHIDLVYYSVAQSALAERVKLPFVYSWLSWCIALGHTTTANVLFHDYDSLLLSTLNEKYRAFEASGAKVQGIRWYNGHGVEVDDHLATTFEAFMDTVWLRSLDPISLFNKMRIINGRSIDFDTTLDAQYRLLRRDERTTAPMEPDEIVHPSQMIHQYTMFRHSPGARLPCFSIPMIPFFCYLSGRTDAIDCATQSLKQEQRHALNLLGDGTLINLSALTVEQVDWQLKQMVRACLSLSVKPDHRIYSYGLALYRAIDTPLQYIWRGDFTDRQRIWILAAESGG